MQFPYKIMNFKKKSVKEKHKIDEVCLSNKTCAFPSKAPQLGSSCTFDLGAPLITMLPKNKTQIKGKKKEREKLSHLSK